MSAGAVEKSVASRQPPDTLLEAAQALAAQPVAAVEVVAFRGAPFRPRDSIEESQASVAVVQGPVLATVAWILPTTIETRRPLSATAQQIASWYSTAEGNVNRTDC